MAALQVGDMVNVPGDMYGTLKFIGSVDGKKGTFAGVELAAQFAERGKNSGDVEGKQYFRTAVPGGGIFLPIAKADKRSSGSSTTGSTKQSSMRTTSVTTSPPSLPVQPRPTPRIVKPSFSQSLGPSSLGRVSSPTALKPPGRRESSVRPTSPLRPRPSSPVRRTTGAPAVQTPAAGKLTTPKTRPSVGLARSVIGAPGTTGKGSGLRVPSYATGGSNKFSQSLRQSTSQTPNRIRGVPPRAASTTPLGPDDRFDEDDTILETNEPDTTPTPAVRNGDRASASNAERLAQETQRLREQLGERDRQLADQANNFAEMEHSLAELQNMLPDALGQRNQEDEFDLPRDVQGLRAQLRDKNERIKALSMEFDANRADFRSTIDTLEMASTETERVYEQRLEDLLLQVQQLQERNEDVDSVAQQFKQLEELVQELEEGLEESRRAEAEARSEVEFLRGEVERGKSELRRERERAAAHAALEGDGDGDTSEQLEEVQSTLIRKDDEIRGLKAIIQSLQGTAPADRSSYERPSSPKTNGLSQRHSKKQSTNTITSPESKNSSEALQRQIHDLESLLQQKSTRESQLQDEVRELRMSANVDTIKWSYPVSTSVALGLGNRRTDSLTDKHISGGSQRTILGQTRESTSPEQIDRRRKESVVPDLANQDDSHYTSGRGSPLKDEFGIDTADSEEANEDRRRRSANFPLGASQGPRSVSETSTGAQWCEICEESGHDILNCANMMGSSTHRQPSPQPEVRLGKDAVPEGLIRSNGSGQLYASDRPAPLRKPGTYESPHPPPSAPLPPPPAKSGSLAANSNGGGSNRSSATPANSAPNTSSTTATPTKSTLIEGTGAQAGMLAGKISGVIDPERWCALCERDGHESVDCPVEDAF